MSSERPARRAGLRPRKRDGHREILKASNNHKEVSQWPVRTSIEIEGLLGKLQESTESDVLRDLASLLAEALRIEVAEYLATLKENGRDVVRNDFLPERTVSTGIGPVPVQVPPIRSWDDELDIFRS